MVILLSIGTSGRFDLGRICSTPAALDAVSTEDVTAALARHSQCDWGNLNEEDKRVNNRALEHGERLLSAYQTSSRTKFWIITEADRSVTTILLPEDY